MCVSLPLADLDLPSLDSSSSHWSSNGASYNLVNDCWMIVGAPYTVIGGSFTLDDKTVADCDAVLCTPVVVS